MDNLNIVFYSKNLHKIIFDFLYHFSYFYSFLLKIKKNYPNNITIKKVGIFPIKKITINPGNEYIKRNCNIDDILKNSEIIINTNINIKDCYKDKLQDLKERTHNLLEKYNSKTSN